MNEWTGKQRWIRSQPGKGLLVGDNKGRRTRRARGHTMYVCITHLCMNKRGLSFGCLPPGLPCRSAAVQTDPDQETTSLNILRPYRSLQTPAYTVELRGRSLTTIGKDNSEPPDAAALRIFLPWTPVATLMQCNPILARNKQIRQQQRNMQAPGRGQSGSWLCLAATATSVTCVCLPCVGMYEVSASECRAAGREPCRYDMI